MRIEYVTAAMLDKSPIIESEVVIVMPATDPVQAQRSAGLMARRAGAKGVVLVVYDEDRQGFIATANQAFRNSRGEYFAYVAQDAFAGRLWLKVALHQLNLTHKGMLAFNDGKWHGLLASFGMVRRAWAVSHYGGNLFSSDYHSHYGDAELTLVARAHDQLSYAARSVMVEVDWEKDDRPTNDADRQIFFRRRKTLFDGLVPTEADCRIFAQASHNRIESGTQPEGRTANS